MKCPVCTKPLVEAGQTHKCEACEGAWIAEDALVAVLEQRASTLVKLPWAPRVGNPRPCAVCQDAMQTVDLGSVQLDRCAKHGVWLDANELTALLRQVKQFKTHPAGHEASDDDDQRDGLLRRFARALTGGGD